MPNPKNTRFQTLTMKASKLSGGEKYLAQRLACSRRSISRWAKGDTIPHPTFVTAMQKILDDHAVDL